MQDASNELEQLAAARWRLYDIDACLKALAILGLAAALVIALAYLAPYAEELTA